jgi:putative RecB family exonuclease
MQPQETAPSRTPAMTAEAITGRPYLSWSQVSAYSMCPKAFEFRYVLRAPPDFVPSSLVFGSALHDAVASVTQADLEGSPRPPTAQLAARMAQQLASTEVPLKFGKGETLESLVALGTRMLDAYVASPESRPSGTTVLIEEATRETLTEDLPPIEARVDHVYRRADGSIVVRDVKSSRTRWSPDKVMEAAPQLRLYARLLGRDLAPLGRIAALEFVVITKAAKPVVTAHEIPVNDDDDGNDGLVEQISATWHGITSGVFPARPGWPCKSCPFASKCSAAIGVTKGASDGEPQ